MFLMCQDVEEALRNNVNLQTTWNTLQIRMQIIVEKFHSMTENYSQTDKAEYRRKYEVEISECCMAFGIMLVTILSYKSFFSRRYIQYYEFTISRWINSIIFNETKLFLVCK